MKPELLVSLTILLCFTFLASPAGADPGDASASVVIQGEQRTVERRYFLSSLPPDAKLHGTVVRSHWAIENTLHWTLDMTFGEDQSRVRDRQAAENMAMVRHMALNMLQSAKKRYKKDMSINRLRKKAGWGANTLHTILKQPII